MLVRVCVCLCDCVFGLPFSCLSVSRYSVCLMLLTALDEREKLQSWKGICVFSSLFCRLIRVALKPSCRECFEFFRILRTLARAQGFVYYDGKMIQFCHQDTLNHFLNLIAILKAETNISEKKS